MFSEQTLYSLRPPLETGVLLLLLLPLYWSLLSLNLPIVNFLIHYAKAIALLKANSPYSCLSQSHSHYASQVVALLHAITLHSSHGLSETSYMPIAKNSISPIFILCASQALTIDRLLRLSPKDVRRSIDYGSHNTQPLFQEHCNATPSQPIAFISILTTLLGSFGHHRHGSYHLSIIILLPLPISRASLLTLSLIITLFD